MRHAAAPLTPYFFEGSPKKFTNEASGTVCSAPTPLSSSSSYVVYVNNSKNRTQEPSKMMANPFGLENMLGNVMEYCSDWYAEDAYSQMRTAQPTRRVPLGRARRARRSTTRMLRKMRCRTCLTPSMTHGSKTDPAEPQEYMVVLGYKGYRLPRRVRRGSRGRIGTVVPAAGNETNQPEYSLKHLTL